MPIDHEMQLKSVVPTHRAFALCGQASGYFMREFPFYLTYRQGHAICKLHVHSLLAMLSNCLQEDNGIAGELMNTRHKVLPVVIFPALMPDEELE